MKFFRRLRKRLGLYTRKEVMVTYANAVQHGRSVPSNISDEDMVEQGVKMINDWMKALNNI